MITVELKAQFHLPIIHAPHPRTRTVIKTVTPDEPVWIKDNGDCLPVSTMSDEHIKNCIKMIQEGRIARPSCDGINTQDWIDVFATELAYRGR